VAPGPTAFECRSSRSASPFRVLPCSNTSVSTKDTPRLHEALAWRSADHFCPYAFHHAAVWSSRRPCAGRYQPTGVVVSESVPVWLRGTLEVVNRIVNDFAYDFVVPVLGHPSGVTLLLPRRVGIGDSALAGRREDCGAIFAKVSANPVSPSDLLAVCTLPDRTVGDLKSLSPG
jgi:hypothetical protein